MRDKDRANFCDYFKPAGGRHDPSLQAASDQAQTQLDALFGEQGEAPETKSPGADDLKAAEDLFK